MKIKETNQSITVKVPFYYGWVIVVVAAVGLFFSGPGQTYSISVAINSYIENYGFSRSLISSLYSIATLAAGLILPIIGKRVDAVGHRKMIVLVSSLLGVTCLFMSFVTSPVTLFIGFIFLRLLGQGSMTLIPSTLVSQWFIQKRGIAISLMSLGGVASSALIPLLNNWLIMKSGLAFTWRLWAVLLICIMAPIGWLIVRNKPENVGLLPDGKLNQNSVPNTKYYIKLSEQERSWTLTEAMKTRAFWLMLFCMTIPAMINTGLTFHIVSIIGIKGFSSTFAATMLGVTAIVQLCLTFVAGYLLDKVKPHYVKGIIFLFLVIAMLIIIYGKSHTLLITYGIILGIFSIFDSLSTEIIWPSYFGRENLGSIRSVAATAMVIGSALGPLPFGFAYDTFKGYKEIIFIMMIFPILGSIASFLSPAPKYRNN
jgi:MFS family permease